MIQSIGKTLGWFLLLLLLQVLVFNHIHLLGYATPIVIVYFTLLFPDNAPRGVTLLSSFFLGLVFDIFSNTPGMASFSMTLVAFLQPTLLALCHPKEDENEVFNPSLSTMGRLSFSVYMMLGILIFCSVFFLLESFSFFNWKDLLLNICGSSLLSFLFIFAIDSLRPKSGR